jgi:hypothetical protein
MVTAETKSDVLIAIVIKDEGISSIRIGADTDESTEKCHKLLAKISSQIRSLDAAARLAAL